MAYAWKQNRFAVAADIAVNEIVKCKNTDGFVKQEIIVARAADKDNPLHPCFEWDDTIAAKEYRIRQAGDILRALVVVEESTNNTPINMYVNIETNGTRGYKELTAVLQNDTERAILLGKALNDLGAYERRYHLLSGLEPIFEKARTWLQREIKSEHMSA